jgi:hypothetical protein
MNEVREAAGPDADRWTLIRDIAVLQVKLIVDGLRDLILVPVSLIAGIASLATSQEGKPGLHFYRLLQFGKQTERYINLFAAAKNAPETVAPTEAIGSGDIDDLVGKFESFVIDEYKRGGVTAQAKDHFDKIINAVQRKNRSD